MEELGIYLLSFDRPGDADPGRTTEKSIALDIQELADNLQLGLKYIPHRSGSGSGTALSAACSTLLPSPI
jgi:hypothetical protein